MTEWLAKKYNVPFYRSNVGEANVVDMMLAHDALYGGEGSGGPIDPRVGFIRDSFVGIAHVLDLMAHSQSTVSELTAQLPRLAMIKDKMTLSKEKLNASIAKLAARLNANRISNLDGVRLDWSDRWLLLRGSNTEPIVRLIAESPNESDSLSLINQAKAIMAEDGVVGN
jgi:phosphomannomutase